MTYLIDAWLDRPHPYLRILHRETGEVCAVLEEEALSELQDQGDLDVNGLSCCEPMVLKELVRELLGQEVSKQQQSSDWGAAELSEAQRDYAASDVRFLHAMKTILDARLAREGRTELAQACFDFLPTRAALDLAGWPEVDIFAHT